MFILLWVFGVLSWLLAVSSIAGLSSDANSDEGQTALRLAVRLVILLFWVTVSIFSFYFLIYGGCV